MATMLQLIQDVSNELGIDAPNAVASSTDKTYVQLLALINRVGYELVNDGYNWQNLKTINRLVSISSTDAGGVTTDGSPTLTVADTSSLAVGYHIAGTGIPNDTHIVSIDSGTTLTMDWNATATGTGITITFSKDKYPVPSDYFKMLGATFWDKTNQWEITGAKTSQEWEYLTSGVVGSTPFKKFRIFNNNFEIFPAPPNNERYSFEYFSNYWALSSGGTAKTSFTADDDTSKLPDDLLVMGTKLRFFEVKGFDSMQLANEFKIAVQNAISTDSGTEILSLAPQYGSVLVSRFNVPESNFNL